MIVLLLLIALISQSYSDQTKALHAAVHHDGMQYTLLGAPASIS